jgi:hypothetical protein
MDEIEKEEEEEEVVAVVVLEEEVAAVVVLEEEVAAVSWKNECSQAAEEMEVLLLKLLLLSVVVPLEVGSAVAAAASAALGASRQRLIRMNTRLHDVVAMLTVAEAATDQEIASTSLHVRTIHFPLSVGAQAGEVHVWSMATSATSEFDHRHKQCTTMFTNHPKA